MKRLAIIVAVLLAGCQTPSSPDAESWAYPTPPPSEVILAQAQAWHDFADTTCRTYGFKPGMIEYEQCRFQLDMQRRNQAVQRKTAVDATVLGMLLQLAAPGPPRHFQPFTPVTLPPPPVITFQPITN